MAKDGLINSVMAVIVGGFITLVLIMCLGETMDKLVLAFTKAGMYDVATEWSSPTDTMISVMYLACWMPLAASIIYALFNVRRQKPQDVSRIQDVDYY